jgi:uncharacterized membrane protein YkvI
MTADVASVWQRYFLPAFAFMAVVIGGGYATGRELVEFFMPAGPIGGLLGLAVTAVVWSVIFALSLEFARITGSYDYQAFFRQLLGRGWVLFEVSFLSLLLIILAVIGAASGEIVADVFLVPPWAGTVILLLLIALLAWLGTRAVEVFFSSWGALLIVAYVGFMALCLATFGDDVEATFQAAHGPGSGWFRGGITYAGYNIMVMPALLFCARHQRRRRETLVAGALTGPIAILPALVFFIAMQAKYPDILDAAIPLQMLLHALDIPWLTVAMQLAIFGTLVQTGTGVLHGFNERLLGLRADSGTTYIRKFRLTVSVVLCLVAMWLATRIGLIELIGKGYGYLAWLVIAVYAVPLVTVGALRIFGGSRPSENGRRQTSGRTAYSDDSKARSE